MNAFNSNPLPDHPVHGTACEAYHYDRNDGTRCLQAKYRNSLDAPKTCAWWVAGTDKAWHLSRGDVKAADLKPYRWSQLDNEHTQREPIAVCEGPKDADALNGLGVIATDGKLLVPAHADWFDGRDVVIIQDRDPAATAQTGGGYGVRPSTQTPGERFASKAAGIIRPVAKRCAIVTMPGDGVKDAADWVALQTGTAAEKAKIVRGMFATALAQDDGAAAEAEPEPAADAELSALQLPERFWLARPWLAELRGYAWSRRYDPDLLLGATLARYAAMLPPGTSFDSGIHSERASPNLLVAGIGRPGTGKSGALGATKTIVVANPFLDCAAGPLGSGEGIAEAFMGVVEEVDGKKKKYVRKQVRHNAFLFLDEGQSLFKLTAQTSNCTMQALRTVFIGEELGNMNASAERKRVVTDYHCGLFIGFQPATVAPLLADTVGGTPQRFIFLKAGKRPADRPADAQKPALSMPPGFIPVQIPQHLRTEVRRLLDERERQSEEREAAGVPDDDWEAHGAVLLCKLATLFCIIDGRQVVTDDDWALAEIIVDTSRRVRNWLGGVAADAVAAERHERITERVQTAERSALATRTVEERVEKLARAIGRKVWSAGGAQKTPLIKSTIRLSERHLAPDALRLAESKNWLVVDGGRLTQGTCQP